MNNSNNPQTQIISIFRDSFEGSISSRWARQFPNDVYSGTISTNYAKNGTSSLRIELRNTDPNFYGSKRAEIALKNSEPPLQHNLYSFSTYLPNGGDEDYALDPNGSEIIAQWHGTPDPGEQSVYPSLALHTGAYYNYPDHYSLEVTWDANPNSTEAQIDARGTHIHYDLGSYIGDKGKWVTWTFHVKWGWLVFHHPLIQIYKDGVKIFELIDKPNTTNDRKGIYLKLGIYKWDWAQIGSNNRSILSKRIIYYDAVCVETLKK